MVMSSQVQKALQLQKLHIMHSALILPNAWDAASARIFELAGFEAIGTTSAGIATSCGYADGQRIPFGEMIASVQRITSAVKIPVTADIEAGYGDSLEQIVDNVEAIITAGAVGINLEDATGDPSRPLYDESIQVEKIRAIREKATSLGISLVINARTDLYWLGIGDSRDRFSETVRRTNAYREAGADCLFIPGVRDRDVIGQLVREVNGPTNVLVGPGSPSVAELQRLGVARISTGSGPMRATLALIRSIANDLLMNGTYGGMSHQIPYDEADGLFR